jgi:SAM-dependent methyltransferase
MVGRMEDLFAPFATRYDPSLGAMGEPAKIDPVVDVLAELAGRGRALEFAIGTGRIALPLAARGVPVAGVDLSEPMVAELRKKPGGEEIPVTIGSMTSTRVEGSFRVVYLVFNTIGNLVSQELQVECFANAAAHLAPGGCFVIELEVPQLRRLPPGERFVVFSATERHGGIDEYEPATQKLTSHHYSSTHGYSSMPFRYAWPAELDLMARLAGLRLRDRWADWDRSPFTDESTTHVSIWEKP